MATIQYDRQDANPRQMHIQVRPGEIGEYVIAPGDPGRCEVIAGRLDDARLVAQNREHITYTGKYCGIGVSVTSTGMGCPSAAIAAEELAKCGAKAIIRLGGGFLMRQEMKPGDIAITLASMKNEGTSAFFVPASFPAVADPDLCVALIRSADRILAGTGQNAHTGITACVDGFYGETDAFLQELRSYRIMNIEMESAAIFTVCHRYGIRGACICACGVDDQREEAQLLRAATTLRQIDIALEAIRLFDESQKNGLLLVQPPLGQGGKTEGGEGCGYDSI